MLLDVLAIVRHVWDEGAPAVVPPRLVSADALRRDIGGSCRRSHDEQLVALAAVAVGARRHEVVGAAGPASRKRHYVVDVKRGDVGAGPAVDTPKSVAMKHLEPHPRICFLSFH